jgi:hypothetical protein
MSTPRNPRYAHHKRELDLLSRNVAYLTDYEIQGQLKMRISDMQSDGYAPQVIRTLLTHYADMAVLEAQREHRNVAEACLFYRLVHLHLENVTVEVSLIEQSILNLWNTCVSDAPKQGAIEDIQELITQTREIAREAGWPASGAQIFFVNLKEMLKRDTTWDPSLEPIVRLLEIETEFN